MKDLETIIDDLILREGGYVNHPADRGGPTKYGITQRTLATYRQRPVSIRDVQNLERAEAKDIYRGKYLTEPRLDRVQDPYVLVLAFDCSVHHGPQRAVRWLQQLVNVVDDGILGPISEVAINTHDPVRLYYRLAAKRMRFMGNLISHDTALDKAKKAGLDLQAEFAAGWMNRVAEFVEGI